MGSGLLRGRVGRLQGTVAWASGPIHKSVRLSAKVLCADAGAPWTEAAGRQPCEYTGGLAAARRGRSNRPLDLRRLLEYAKRAHSTLGVGW